MRPSRGKGKPRVLGDEDLERHAHAVEGILAEVRSADPSAGIGLTAILRRHPRDGNSLFSKSELIRTYRHLCEAGRLDFDPEILARIQAKPVRTASGVTPVTVLVKPFPCPGECIFCPTDDRMPKSYIHDEPAAMRAERNAFDPYAQTAQRIAAFHANGHAVDKIELLILGGTWTSYPPDYQEHFLRRCFDAMNAATDDSAPARSLAEAHARNESSPHRNVGLVIETRPDHVDPVEIRRLRSYGVTKVQMGAQSLDDRILALNHRGHTVEETRRAVGLLRAAGFKIVLHWMPNLLGATLEGDLADFERLWADPGLCPDEIKIYSTALLENAELYRYWLRGEYRPYEEADLVDLVIRCKERVPVYCRINRLYRDIPTNHIVAGTKMSNLRQYVQARMADEGSRCRCIRCREIGNGQADWESLGLSDSTYRTRAAEEHFLAFENDRDRLAGYLRLSLPDDPGRAIGEDLGIPELSGAAIVREVHVYGPSLEIGRHAQARAQHQGLGTRLLAEAERIAAERGYPRMCVIASVGTRAYYAARGYALEGTYMVRSL